jgi:hypothetical protein
MVRQGLATDGLAISNFQFSDHQSRAISRSSSAFLYVLCGKRFSGFGDVWQFWHF